MNRHCPMCGAEQCAAIKTIHMRFPDEMPLPNEYQIVSCGGCGGCYANTPATQADYDYYYSACNNYSGQDVDNVFGQILSLVKAFCASHLEPSSSILDIGFGNGRLLERLHGAGYKNLFGIDPSADSVDHLNQNGKIHAYRKSIYDEPNELAGEMDAVFLISVLEHLLHPKTALEKACKYVKDNGYLIVNVPDYSMSDKIELPVSNQFNQEHINYFSEDSFQTMLDGLPCKLIYSESLESDAVSGGRMGSEYSRVFILKKAREKIHYPLIKDTLTCKSIEVYLAKQEKRQERIYALIHKHHIAQTPLVVWGTGAWTMFLLSESELSKCNIVAYADGNKLKVGKKFGETSVIAPEEIKNYPDATVFICAMKYAEEIENTLREMKLPNPVVVIE